MDLLNLDALRVAPVSSDPFEHLIARGFVPQSEMGHVLADYPTIQKGGSFPQDAVPGGPLFEKLCRALRGPEVRTVFAEKFGMDLSNRPTTLTVRGRCRLKDGQIHTDSKSKLVTVLLYLNEPWAADGGRLRLLRSEDLSDYAVEAPPHFGTLLAFKNGPTAWHGHAPFEGVRRALQLNYVTDEAAVRRSERRHGVSAMVKRWNPFKRAA
ncbi:2OG-Fe(II) oxygenase [Botrimarina sp.]|uniref:2OG-Fe(II) oxygenase n=1 Tax=Botrimarina sp. TaxID=2795802 RepID=UPI0032EBBF31